MLKQFATVFPNFTPVHWTKDVGMLAAALAKCSENDAKSYIYHRSVERIEEPEFMSLYVKSINIYSNSILLFYIKVVLSILKRNIDAITLYHIDRKTIFLTLVFKILAKRVHIKLDLNLISAQKLFKLWDKNSRPSSIITKFIIGLADCVTCETKEIHELIQKYKWVSRKVEFVPNSILIETIPVTHKNTTQLLNRIIFIGRLGTKQKNAEAVLNALADIPINQFTWQLLLCGNSTKEFEDKFFSLIRFRPDLADRVILAGNLSRDELFEYLRSAKVFLMTSRYEGFSLAALEAAWMGCLIIGTSVGGLAELTDNWRLGIQLPHEDDQALKNILINLCNDKIDLINDYQDRLAYVHKNFNICEPVKKIIYSLNRRPVINAFFNNNR